VLLNADSFKSNTGLMGVSKYPLARSARKPPEPELAETSDSSSGGSSLVFGRRDDGSNVTPPRSPCRQALVPVRAHSGLERVSEGGRARGSNASDASGDPPPRGSRLKTVRVKPGHRDMASRRPASSVDAEQGGSDGVSLTRGDRSRDLSVASADDSWDAASGILRGRARGSPHAVTPLSRTRSVPPSALRKAAQAKGEGGGEADRRGNTDDEALKKGSLSGLSGLSVGSGANVEWRRQAAEAGDSSDSSDERLRSLTRSSSIGRAPKKVKSACVPPLPRPSFAPAASLAARPASRSSALAFARGVSGGWHDGDDEDVVMMMMRRRTCILRMCQGPHESSRLG
jgi:hypothetical protein